MRVIQVVKVNACHLSPPPPHPPPPLTRPACLLRVGPVVGPFDASLSPVEEALLPSVCLNEPRCLFELWLRDGKHSEAEGPACQRPGGPGASSQSLERIVIDISSPRPFFGFRTSLPKNVRKWQRDADLAPTAPLQHVFHLESYKNPRKAAKPGKNSQKCLAVSQSSDSKHKLMTNMLANCCCVQHFFRSCDECETTPPPAARHA